MAWAALLLVLLPALLTGGSPSGGTSTGAKYPLKASDFVSRYPAPDGVFDIPPTLEQLNKPRPYDLPTTKGKYLDGFTLWTVDDFSEHDPEIQEYVSMHGRDLENGDYHLIIRLFKAPELTDLFFYVRYDQDKYHPVQCVPGSAFGMEGDRLWYERHDVPGLVCAGMTRIRPDVNGGTKFEDAVVCEIVFAERPFDYRSPHWLERAPDLRVNRPEGVTAYADPKDCSVTLYWREVNHGDYNNDGEVTMTDLIVISRRYGRLSTDGHEDDWDRLPDSNHDGEVNYRDQWPVNDHLGTILSGYRVYRRKASEKEETAVMLPHPTYPILPMSIHRPRDWDPIRQNEYRYVDRDVPVTETPTDWVYRIVPYNAAHDIEGEGSDVEITVRISDDGIDIEDRSDGKDFNFRKERDSRVRSNR